MQETQRTFKNFFRENFHQILLFGGVAIYIFMIFAVYPFYYQNGYYDMGTAKYVYFRIITASFFMVMTAGLIISIVKGRKDISLRGSSDRILYTDCCAVAYLIFCWLSYAISEYRTLAFWGFEGWYMGVVMQSALVLLYFMVSRYFIWSDHYLWVMLIPSSIVFLLGVLNRFRIDPLGMLDDKFIARHFLSTIGQPTWYSSYLSVILPIGMVYYWYKKRDRLTPMWIAYLIIGFGTLATQNSDSAFMAAFGVFAVLFWLSFHKNEYFKRFLELVTICLGTFQIMGILQRIFPDAAVDLDTFSTFLSQHWLVGVVWLITVLFYIAFLLAKKRQKIDITKLKLLRNILYILLVCGVVLVLVLMYLVTTGRVSSELLDKIGYFRFDENWGQSRGHTWMMAWQSFWDANPIKKLLGCGPDTYKYLVYSTNQADLVRKWGESLVITNAHNEWLNSLVTTGIAGTVAYIGIFATSFAGFIGKWKSHPFLLAGAAVIVSYFLHNFFCYQQVVCTPLIFLIMGMGAAILRDESTKSVME